MWNFPPAITLNWNQSWGMVCPGPVIGLRSNYLFSSQSKFRNFALQEGWGWQISNGLKPTCF